jgi:anti-anti-sigma regulatory factor
MNIEINAEFEFTIDGSIRSVDDFNKIKETIEPMIAQAPDSITINIVNSISITSSVIGLFLKAVQKDGINITLKVNDERLETLLDDLSLKDIFHVTKI